MTPAAPAIRERRTLRFETVDDAIADVASLRHGYARTRSWSLPQIAWHLGVIVDRYLKPAAPGAVATAEQAAKKRLFVDAILNGTAPATGEASPDLVAPATAGDEAIELFDRQFARLRDYPHAFVDMGACGPVAIDEARRCHLIHAAHHLAFLVPAEAEVNCA